MSENTDPQSQPPIWGPPSDSVNGGASPQPYQQPTYQQPPFEQAAAGAYPPPPPYAPPPGYGLQPVPPYAGDTSSASMAHWLPILIGLWGPLILMLTTGTRDPFVRAHAVESLNFSLTLTIVYLSSALLGFLCVVPWLIIPVAGIAALVLHIMAAMAASRGEMYRYPLVLRMVS